MSKYSSATFFPQENSNALGEPKDLENIFIYLDTWVAKHSRDGYVGADSNPTINASLDHGIQQVREEIREFVAVLLAKGLHGTILEIGLGEHGGTHMLWRQIFDKVVTLEVDSALAEQFQRNESLDSKSLIIVGNSRDATIVDQVHQLLKEIDVLFIDGDHSREAVYEDWQMYRDLVRSGGLIVFHDSASSYHEVSRFLEKLSTGEMDGVRHELHNIVHSREQGISYEIINPSNPKFFLVTTPGLSATRWLSFVLASHEDVFVAHGKHSLISVIQGDFTREKRADDVESFTKGNDLKDFYASKSVDEVFEVYQAIMPGARAYGNVHSYTIETLMKAVKSEQNLAGIQILNLLRHPVNYIDSHYSMVRSAEKHPELYHHYKEVMFKEAMEQYPELVLMENFDSKELLAFAVSCLSVCNQAKDFAYPQFKHIQMEKITTDVVVLQETCEALTGLVYSTTELETFIKRGSINSHRKKSSSSHPEDVYTSWTNWQQDIAHMMLPADVLDKFEENGYDISMLRMPDRKIIQEAVLDDKSVETTASLPAHPSHDVFDYREALISIASSLLQAGQTEEALFHLQRLVANYPDSADAHCRLGEGLVHGGKTDEAAQAFERAIALHPHHAPAYANLATIKQSDGQDNEAIDLLRTLTELTPNDVSAHNNLGQILYLAGKVELAEAAFLKAYQLDPNSAEVHNSLSVLYWEGGNAERAVKHMQQALQLDPQNPDAVVNYALMQEAVGQTEEAIQLLEGYLASHEDGGIQQELKRMRDTGNPENESFIPGEGQGVSKSETPAFTFHV